MILLLPPCFKEVLKLIETFVHVRLYGRENSFRLLHPSVHYFDDFGLNMLLLILLIKQHKLSSLEAILYYV